MTVDRIAQRVGAPEKKEGGEGEGILPSSCATSPKSGRKTWYTSNECFGPISNVWSNLFICRADSSVEDENRKASNNS